MVNRYNYLVSKILRRLRMTATAQDYGRFRMTDEPLQNDCAARNNRRAVSELKQSNRYDNERIFIYRYAL
jgi:hypothetical protein